MSTPEPVDDEHLPPVEIRGGDRDEDFMPGTAPFGSTWPAGAPELPGCGPDCGCEDEPE